MTSVVLALYDGAMLSARAWGPPRPCRHFHRALGVPPDAYRRTFRSARGTTAT
nr:hypothetical protein OG409_03765 [Streptomyces sp. NBC_00974]